MKAVRIGHTHGACRCFGHRFLIQDGCSLLLDTERAALCRGRQYRTDTDEKSQESPLWRPTEGVLGRLAATLFGKATVAEDIEISVKVDSKGLRGGCDEYPREAI